MDGPFIGHEALTAGLVTRHALRTRFVAVHRDVYVSADTPLTPALRARAAWLRSRRRGVLAGLSASALHRAKWIDQRLPATIIDTNRRRVPGVVVWAAHLQDDEICLIDGMAVTTPARTALDLACRNPPLRAITAIDALARATRMTMSDVDRLVARHQGMRGLQAGRSALDLVDAGAESPRETWVRLLLIRNGFPRPQTQIEIRDEYGWTVGYADMGWEDVKVVVEYEGADHRTADRFNKDVRRIECLDELGWIVVRVTKLDTEGSIVGRVARAWERRMLRQGGKSAKRSP